jgi:hypothetical protein
VGNEWSRVEESIVFVRLDMTRTDGVLQCAPFGGDDSSHFSFEECWDVPNQGRLSFGRVTGNLLVSKSDEETGLLGIVGAASDLMCVPSVGYWKLAETQG